MSAWATTVGRVVLRSWRAPAVLLLLTAGVGSLGAQAALAGVRVVPTPLATGAIVWGYRTSKCVDDLGNSIKNDTPIVISDCNGSPEQTWTVESDGTLQVNGKCMDIYRDQKVNKAKVELWTCTGGANQQWMATGGTLVNPISGKCLDDPRFNPTNGTQLEIYTCNGGRNQLWQLPAAPAPAPAS
jgi:hypothetical protein